MKHLYLLFMLFIPMTTLPAVAQVDEIQAIMDRNPFDPERGKTDEEIEETPDEVIEAPAIDLPILDGTIIYGDTKIAVLSFQKDGMNLTARVEMMPNKQGYQLYLREKKKAARKPGRRPTSSTRRDIPESRNRNNRNKNNRNKKEKPASRLLKGDLGEEEEDDKPKFPLDGERNGRIAGYMVTEITRDYIMLQGNEEPFKLEMYREGTKEGRGGTKTVVAKPKPKPKAPNQTKGLSKVKSGDKKTPPKPNAKANKKDGNKPKFNRRQPPKRSNSDRADKLKKRF